MSEGNVKVRVRFVTCMLEFVFDLLNAAIGTL